MCCFSFDVLLLNAVVVLSLDVTYFFCPCRHFGYFSTVSSLRRLHSQHISPAVTYFHYCHVVAVSSVIIVVFAVIVTSAFKVFVVTSAFKVSVVTSAFKVSVITSTFKVSVVTATIPSSCGDLVCNVTSMAARVSPSHSTPHQFEPADLA